MQCDRIGTLKIGCTGNWTSQADGKWTTGVGGNNGVNGYLVPVKAVAELAEAMEQLLVDPALRVTMGMRAG